ncbi:MAG: 2-oxoacid:acceptor oxidoreductase family protein [Eubacteriales bacterium]|nr:2-oxoacid:acceptor oxidoreductase family protein [Eubacteriales bacterium]MDD4540710.1 2-oxoacid:acceptor oxidoreductase family protein [Eubacteriales bacterium]
MAYNEIIFSGFGGQGVMAMGQTLAETGMREGLNVSWLPSYGPEMRGGTANCSVVVADSEIISPTVSEPTILVAMNQPSLAKFSANVRPGGHIFVNSSVVDEKVERDDVTVHYVDSGKIAAELGNDRVANMVMLGAVVGATQLMDLKAVQKMMSEIFTGKKAKLVQLNVDAIQRGADSVS